MRRRWGGEGIVAHRSDPDEYRRFVAEMSAKYDEIRQRRLVRSVTVHRVSKITDGYWQVEFSTTDYDGNNRRLGDALWVASMTVGYFAREVNWQDRYMNPLGFIVSAYSVAARQ
jgi:type IV secretory pathway component VirB8